MVVYDTLVYLTCINPAWDLSAGGWRRVEL